MARYNCNGAKVYTSRSDTYGLSEKFETKLKTWINTPGQIVTDMIQWM
jgi:hypothetical protein